MADTDVSRSRVLRDSVASSARKKGWSYLMQKYEMPAYFVSLCILGVWVVTEILR